MVVCRHCDSFPRTGTHVQIQEKAARARARTRVRAARPLCQVGPTLPPMQCRGRCSPPDALDAQRVVLRHAPAQWPPLDACARRWQRCRAPRRCPLHALALSPRTQPSGESFCTGLCSLDGRHCGTWWHVGDCGRWGEACTSRWRARRGAAWSGVARQWQVGDGRELRVGRRRRGLRSSSCVWTMFGARDSLSLLPVLCAWGVFLGFSLELAAVHTQSPPLGT